MRRAFSLIAAVFFIVMLATIATVALSIATMSVGNTASVYTKEQALILAQNATEYTVMAMKVHDYNQNCLETVTLHYPEAANPLFTATVNIYYLDQNVATNTAGTAPVACTANHIIGRTNINNQATRQTRSAILDVTVRQNGTSVGMPITYNRQTLQIL